MRKIIYFEVEKILESRNEFELLSAFNAMVGCDGEVFYNSLDKEIYNYNNPSSRFYTYTKTLQEKKDIVFAIAEQLNINPKPLYDSFDNMIKKICRDFNINREELAKKLQVTKEELTKWEYEVVPHHANLYFEQLIENEKLKEKLRVIKEARDIISSL